MIIPLIAIGIAIGLVCLLAFALGWDLGKRFGIREAIANAAQRTDDDRKLDDACRWIKNHAAQSKPISSQN